MICTATIVLRRAGLVFAGIAALASAPAASAQGFSGPYDAANWTVPPIADGSTWISRAARFEYLVNLGDPGQGVTHRTATFERALSQFGNCGGPITFHWTYSGMHAFFKAEAQLQVFTETLGGVVTIIDLIEPGTSTFGPFSFSGLTTIELPAGGSWGFIAGGSNEDSNSILEGAIDVANLSPSFASPCHTLNEWTGSIPNGAVGIQNSPAGLDFGYNVFLFNGPVSYRTATFAVPAAEDGTITVDWSYNGFHAFSGAAAHMQLFAETPTGTVTTNLVGPAQGVFSNFFFGGQDASITVHKGMNWGVVTGGGNNDQTGEVRGVAHLYNYRFEEAVCVGDTNGDGVVDFADLNNVLTDYSSSGPDLIGDINNDGTVDFGDLNLVLSNYSTTC